MNHVHTPGSDPYWFLLVGCLLTTLGCQTAPQRPLESQVSTPALTSFQSELSANPDMVTVLPFERKTANGDSADPQEILLRAEVDGRSGIFCLDTGSPIFFLNAAYLRATPMRGLDTVTTAHAEERRTTVHLLRVGTLVHVVDSLAVGLPWQTDPMRIMPVTNALVRNYSRDGLLGNLGLTSIEPFEIIIDYPHQQVIVIRLDRLGRRLVPVPAYTPQAVLPLMPSKDSQHWGIPLQLGTAVDTLIVDTGADVPLGLSREALAHLHSNAASSDSIVLNRLTIGGRTLSRVTGYASPYPGVNVLGYGVLSQLGVVGLNMRTHQLVLYRAGGGGR